MPKPWNEILTEALHAPISTGRHFGSPQSSRLQAGATMTEALDPTPRSNVKQWLTVNGVTKPISHWAREAGISYQTIQHRLNMLKMTPEQALSVPVRGRRTRRTPSGS